MGYKTWKILAAVFFAAALLMTGALAAEAPAESLLGAEAMILPEALPPEETVPEDPAGVEAAEEAPSVDGSGSGLWGDNHAWTINDSGVLTVSGTGVTPVGAGPWNTAEYFSSITAVVVQEGITGLNQSNFAGLKNLTSVILPEGLSSIGARAFQNCTALESINFPEGLTTIGFEAFEMCTALREAELPEGLTEIGMEAFYKCISLTHLELGPALESLGDDCFFMGKDSLTISYAGSYYDWYILGGFDSGIDVSAVTFGATYSLDITDTIEVWLDEDGTLYVQGSGAMPDYAYGTAPWHEGRDAIRAVVVSPGITHIGKYAFYDGGNVASVSLPEGLVSIGDQAFNGCAFEELVLPSTLETIGTSAFSNCKSLTAVEIPEGVTAIGGSAFKSCNALVKAAIPGTVTTMGGGVFSSCNNLVLVDYGATRYDWYVIGGQNAGLKDGAVTYNGQMTFVLTDTITVTILDDGSCVVSGTGAMPDYSSSSSIPWNKGRDAITGVTVTAGITYVCKNAFWDCENLTAVSLADTVTALGNSAFSNCWQLTSLELGSGLASLGSSVFYGCEGLTTVNLPAGLTTVGRSAFSNCSALVKLTMLSRSCDCSASSTSLGTAGQTVLYGIPGSTLETYAEKYGFTFVALDVDGDGVLGVSDAGLVLGSAIGIVDSFGGETAAEESVRRGAADANGDGIIDARDATQILRYAYENTSVYVG